MTKVPRVRKFIAHEPGFTIIDAMDRLFPQWLVALADGTVAAIVPSDDHARAVIAEGRAVAVYTLDEIARLLSAYPDIAKAKLIFPGAARPWIWKTSAGGGGLHPHR